MSGDLRHESIPFTIQTLSRPDEGREGTCPLTRVRLLLLPTCLFYNTTRLLWYCGKKRNVLHVNPFTSVSPQNRATNKPTPYIVNTDQ